MRSADNILKSRSTPRPAPPPGRDPNLNIPGVRYIHDRLHGTVEDDEDANVFLRIGGKRRSLAWLVKLLESYRGFQFELTLYEDADPDSLQRMAEALEGVTGGTLVGNHSSVYARRLEYELGLAAPGRRYAFRVDYRSLVVQRVEGDRKRPAWRLSTPVDGDWSLERKEKRSWVNAGVGLSFQEAVERVVAAESS